ncbi:ATP-binding protein [Marinimicrobium sp. ABcell2]|uniref:ATP-binding protein n=1 Tax=Marinimicrobium sp. ABcell2 TaxID=3069751 RepID=UPI0027B21F65|nr:ATP-binding protein [Marinimicrobium sp. ABcell2]MDQ2076792.1 ATP-binding protein [Marinimicrobium sp. ABcell2]
MSKDNNMKPPDSRVHKVTFPWLSTLAGLALILYLLALSDPGLLNFYDIPAIWLRDEIKYLFLAVFVCLLFRDLIRYHRQYRNQGKDIKRLRNQVTELWQSKKQLQLKAHTYSGHADKLKLFISDKLLDYIEYDEKFLHFKSIAAEVRHNGVISFDKVQTVLKDLANAEADRAPDHQDVQAALEAMRYLWDLLDLSTADNLALHIGNLLCECEEHYCQQMLDVADAPLLPYEPVYSPQAAAWRALGLVRSEPLSPLLDQQDYRLVDSQWFVNLSTVGSLLGNENHLVLLLENLLKNAQFFSGKRGYKVPFAPVALTLAENQGYAHVCVYNRGPHIREEDRPNLFQLGFSTRRAREHHGRGLGLYFVNEIVKGYEGQIQVHNIYTPEASYTVRLELDNGDILTDRVEVVLVDGQPQCRAPEGGYEEAREWPLDAALRSVEVTAVSEQLHEATQRLEAFATKGKQERFDPAHPERPFWRLSYQPQRSARRLCFEPMDISGVQFDVLLPTAAQRLDNTELDLAEDIDAEVERLDERFRARVVQGGST